MSEELMITLIAVVIITPICIALLKSFYNALNSEEEIIENE